jgi:multicomponent K+:H+ antiporter subunit A
MTPTNRVSRHDGLAFGNGTPRLEPAARSRSLPPGLRRLPAASAAAALRACRGSRRRGERDGRLPGLLLPDCAPAAWPAADADLRGSPGCPPTGLDLSLRLDGLGLLFCLLILGIGLLVVLYAAWYLPESDRLGRFYSILLLFMAAMLGVVLSENLLLLLIFWEITSLSSFLLVAYRSDKYESRIGARMALAVTGGGGLALLRRHPAARPIAGSFDLSVILAAGDAYPRARALRADADPDPARRVHQVGAVSLPLLAAERDGGADAGLGLPAFGDDGQGRVFLLARLYPALGGSDLWFWLVSGSGALTLVYAAAIALFRNDIKGLLAYSTISHLGLITLLFGLDTPLSVVAGIFHIINHAIFKASLFMAAGVIDHECGTRDMRRVNGMFRVMPITATLAIIAAGSMAGVPLLNGFLSKEMFFAETVSAPQFATLAWALPLFATLAGMLAVAYSSRFVHDVFFNGEPIDLPRQPHEPPRWMRAPIELLVLLLSAGRPVSGLDGRRPARCRGTAPRCRDRCRNLTLALWHGFNQPCADEPAGAGRRRHHLCVARAAIRLAGTVAADARAHRFRALLSLSSASSARRFAAMLDNGSLQRYNALLLSFVVLLGGWAYLLGARPPGSGYPVSRRRSRGSLPC